MSSTLAVLVKARDLIINGSYDPYVQHDRYPINRRHESIGSSVRQASYLLRRGGPSATVSAMECIRDTLECMGLGKNVVVWERTKGTKEQALEIMSRTIATLTNKPVHRGTKKGAGITLFKGEKSFDPPEQELVA